LQSSKAVFNQLLDNKNISHDMVWTKKFQNQMQAAQSYKNCTDPEECGGSWWEGGERYLGYHREAYANANKEDALRMSSPEYVPYQDVMKKAMDLAEQANLSVKQDKITNQWIVTTKNGQQLVGPLMSLFSGTLARDPKIKEYYKANAYVQRQDFIHGNEAKYGSKEAAEAAYIQQLLPSLEKVMSKGDVRLQNLKDHVGLKRKKLAMLKASGAIQDAGAVDEADQVLAAEDSAYGESLINAKNAKGEFEVAKRNGRMAGAQIDNLMTQYSLNRDIGAAAQTLSMKDAEVSYKVNPYGMEAVKQKNRFLFEKYKFQNRIDLEKYKHDLKMAEAGASLTSESGGDGSANVAIPVDGLPGTTSKESDTGAYDRFKETYDYAQNDVSAREKSIVGEAVSVISGAAEGGDAQAREDYVNLYKSYLSAKGEEAKRLAGNRDPEAASRALKNRELLTQLEEADGINQQYMLAKRAGFDMNTLAGSQIDKIYEEGVLKMMDPNIRSNKANRDYLQSLWIKSQPQRLKILGKQRTLEMMDDAFAKEAKDVIKSSRLGNNGKWNEWAEVFEAYVDENGKEVDKQTFITNMKAKGRTAEEAEALYDGKYEVDPDGFWSYAGKGYLTSLAAGAGAAGGHIGDPLLMVYFLKMKKIIRESADYGKQHILI
jgi:hypothetical protein